MPGSRSARAASGSSLRTRSGTRIPSRARARRSSRSRSPWRFFVMIWFDATQSDQPEITWMFSETGLPFGSMSLLPLYVNPFAVSSAFAAVGLYVESSFDCALTDLSVTHEGNRPLSPIASVGRRIAVLTELRDRVAIDRHRQRVPEGDEAVRILRVVEDQRDRVGRRGVEGVVVRLVLRLVRLGDVRDEVVRPVDLAALGQCQRRVVRRRLDVLEAGDERLARPASSAGSCRGRSPAE